MSSLGLPEEVDDELRGETESNDSDWIGEASTDDNELFSGVWSCEIKIMIHSTILHNVHDFE